MKLKVLSPLSIIRLYHRELRRDFPPAERRPLTSMLLLRKKGLYQVFAMVEASGKTAGYAAVAKGQNGALLLDYLAVSAGRRGKGEGGQLLSLLEKQLKGAPLLVEAEDPNTAPSAPEREIRLRRIRFYLKNGFEETPVRCRVFGVHYQILLLHSQDCPQRALEGIYHTLFPDRVYRRQIRFLPPQ